MRFDRGMKKLVGAVGSSLVPLWLGALGCANTTPEVCNDGIDNDSDQLIDCMDPDCGIECPSTGTAELTWGITLDGDPATCADVGGENVTITVLEDGSSLSVPCDQGALSWSEVPAGGYTLAFDLVDSSDEVFATEEAAVTVVAGESTSASVTFELGAPPPACDTILVHKVYTSGGLDASGFSHDFIVLHNMADVATPLDGWTLQFHNGPTPWTSVDLAAQNPALELAAGGYLLVRLGTSGQLGTQLPAPDVVGPQLDIGATSLVVAVMHDDALLPQDSCPDNASDLFGTKGAGCSEGGAEFGGPGFDQAFVRAGCTDTQVNSADFSSAAAGPVENSATAASICPTCE